jgi:hypothetical protein
MVEMTDADGDQMYEKEILNAKADHSQRNILYRSVDNGFHPVKTEVGGKTEFFCRVMYFMKFPEKGYSVQKAVHIPMYKIPKDKQDSQLEPCR